MTLKLFSLTLNFCAFASTVRCSFYRGANCSAFRVGNERVRLPINHAFSGAWCAPKQMRAIAVELLAAHLPWGRLPEYTHTHSAGNTAGPLEMQGRERACLNRIVC